MLLAISALAGPVFASMFLPENPEILPALRRSGIDGSSGARWSGVASCSCGGSKPLTPLRRRSFPVRLVVLCSYIACVIAATAGFSLYRTTGEWRSVSTVLSPALFAYAVGVSLVLLVILQVTRKNPSQGLPKPLAPRERGLVAVPWSEAPAPRQPPIGLGEEAQKARASAMPVPRPRKSRRLKLSYPAWILLGAVSLLLLGGWVFSAFLGGGSTPTAPVSHGSELWE